MRNIKLAPFSDLKLPEGFLVERVNPEMIDLLEYNILKYDPNYPIEHQIPYGRISAYLSEQNPEKLITMSSHLEPEIQRQGIARQLYKQAELDTGRKIIPDLMLSDKSMPLHRKYGLGNEFGLSNYEQVIKEGLTKKAEKQIMESAGKMKTIGSPYEGYETIEIPPEWPPEFAEKGYNKVKRIFNKIGLDDFKSVIPFLKTAGKIAGPAAALMAPSADAAAADVLIPGGLGELGVSPEQAELDRRYLERVRQLSQRKK